VVHSQNDHAVWQGLSEALEAFLAAPPEGIPDTVIDAVSQAVQIGEGVLAPWLFFEAVEQSPMAISITDLEATILYTNPAFAAVTGYSSSEVVGQNQSLLSDETTPSSVYQALWGELLQRRPWNGRLLNRRKDGARYLADLTIVPVVTTGGQVTHYLAMHRDVTAMHRLEQQVRNQKALIESVVDAAPMVIAVLDDNERVVLDNQAYKKLMGDMRGHEPATALLGALKTSMGEALEQMRHRGQGFSEQVVSFHSELGREPRWFSCSGTWIQERELSADGFFEPHRREYLVLIAAEITALKRRQEETRINALRALAAEEELTAGMREVLSGAIFQMQGPLNVIAAAADMLRRRSLAGTEPVRGVLEQALEAGMQALATLKASMPADVDEPRMPINLNELMREVLGISTDRLLKDGVVVDWRPTAVLPTVIGQERRLRCLFKQLVDNALDAMSGRGCLRRELGIATSTDGDWVQITITDTGPGIPEALRRKVFEPFFTAKATAGRHVGMGLAMAQDLANQHAGTIEIDAEYQEGCRIHVRLPGTRTRRENHRRS
jgi:nitrogen fixation negative regulator NifL